MRQSGMSGYDTRGPCVTDGGHIETYEVLVRARKSFEKDGAIDGEVAAHTHGPWHDQHRRDLFAGRTVLPVLSARWQHSHSAAKTPMAAKLGDDAETMPQRAMMARVALNPIEAVRNVRYMLDREPGVRKGA